MKRRVMITLTVLLVILCVALAPPIYLKFKADAKHAEATTNLNGLKLALEAYYKANGRYPDNLDNMMSNIGFTASASTRFKYSFKLISPDNYEITATDKESGKQYILINGKSTQK